jgi:type IV secretory pathway VirB10-like protein
MKSAVIAAILAYAATAQPHGKHGHAHLRQKRELVTKWETVTLTETATVLIDVTATTTIVPSSEPEAPKQPPGQFFEPASATPPAPTPPAEEHKPAPPPPPPAATEPAPPPPVVQQPAPSEKPAPPAAPQPTASPLESKDTSAPSGASRTGDLTFYALGLGACGFNDGGKDQTDNIVALSHLEMGEQSNGNPYCGKTISISANGKTIQAIVRDKCMGCEKDNIDVSEHAFKELFGDLGVGRSTVNWWYN